MIAFETGDDDGTHCCTATHYCTADDYLHALFAIKQHTLKGACIDLVSNE